MQSAIVAEYNLAVVANLVLMTELQYGYPGQQGSSFTRRNTNWIAPRCRTQAESFRLQTGLPCTLFLVLSIVQVCLQSTQR